MRTTLTVLVVTLVVLAGCSGGSGGRADAIGVLTPAAVPSDHLLDDRPPDVGQTGLSNPITLADPRRVRR